MSAAMSCTSNSDCHWHVRYRAALFESDRERMPRRFEEAEKAIFCESRNCSAQPKTTWKRIGFWTMRCMPCALRSCIRWETTAA